MFKKGIALALAGALSLSLLAGCASGGSTQQDSQVKTANLDPNNPVSITIWHYYNGAQQAAFDELVSEFNATEGKDRGIYVEGYSKGSVTDLEKAVTASASGEVGADNLPDVFSTYADTAYAVEQNGKLANIADYVSADELSQYVDGYVDEGYFDGADALYLFPVAKSTEITMVDKTDWEPFAEATGTTTDELSTFEGIADVAKRYYDWTDAQTPDVAGDGKAFYGRDSMSNYFVIAMKQMGIDLLSAEDGKAVVNVDKDKIKKLWDCYYVPYVNGYFTSIGKFRSDDMKTGDLIAYTGSTSSAMYFPDQVIDDDGAKPIDYLVVPAPSMEGANRTQVQQGASMAVTKSDDQHEYAACEFLKWFTAKENNLRFVCDSAYLPVLKEANSTAALDQVVSDQNISIAPKAHDVLASVFDSFDGTTFYTPAASSNGYAVRKVLDYNLSDKAKADRAAVVSAMEGGASHDDAVAPYVTDAAFDAWYDSFVAALDQAKSK